MSAPDDSQDAVISAAAARAAACVEDGIRAALERERAAHANERAELTSRLALVTGDTAAMEARCGDLEERRASLEAQLRSSEAAGALSAAEVRKLRGELEEERDRAESKREALRAEMEMWKESAKKYRKRWEHAEQALRQVKARSTSVKGRGGDGVLATRSPADAASNRAPQHQTEFRAPRKVTASPAARKRARVISSRGGEVAGRRTDAMPSPRVDARAPPATAREGRTCGHGDGGTVTNDCGNKEEQSHRDGGTSGGVREQGHQGDCERERGGDMARARPRADMAGGGGPTGPSGSDGGAKWRQTGAAGVMGREPSLRGRGPNHDWRARGADAREQENFLWGASGDTPQRPRRIPEERSLMRLSGGGEQKLVGDVYANEDRMIFRLAPRRAQAAEADAPSLAAAAVAREADAPPPPAPGDKEIKHVEVVRRKAERALLPGFTCTECEQFYDAAGRTGLQRPGGACTHCPGPGDRSRHRAKWAPPPAPPGYWNLGFGTQQSTDTAGRHD